MFRQLLPARVTVSILVAFAFVGGVVVAGVLLRDRGSPTPTQRYAPATTSRRPPTT